MKHGEALHRLVVTQGWQRNLPGQETKVLVKLTPTIHPPGQCQRSNGVHA
jgi:hypothetical protein